MKFLQASLAFVMAVSAVVMGCQQAPKEVKIAIVAPLSGGLSGWGDLLRNGVMLAVDEWNAQGGVLGKKISVVSADSQGDPAVVKDAVKYDEITYMDILRQGLKVMDLTAVSLCKDNNLPMIIFNMNRPGNIRRVVLGEKVGSLVTA